MKISMVKEYFKHYMNDTLDTFNGLTEETAIDYSTVGIHRGKNDIAKALQTDRLSAYRYSVISNVIEYPLDGKDIMIANVFHYFVRVVKNQYSPLIAGGKYKFIINGNAIEHVMFDLEAEMGNTYLAKNNLHWRLFEETKQKRRIYLDDADSKITDREEAVKDCLRRFFLIADSGQADLSKKYAADDAICILAGSTYPEQFGADGDGCRGITAEEFIQENKRHEDQNHHSFRICDVSAGADSASAVIEMFEPTKLGFKHFDALTVYKPYYNEQWKIELVKDHGWKIKTMHNQPISKFQTIGYDILELP